MGGTTAVDADLRSWGHKGTRYRQKEGKNQGYSTYVVATEKELCRPCIIFVIVLLLMPPPLQTSQFESVQCANNLICSCPEQWRHPFPDADEPSPVMTKLRVTTSASASATPALW